MDAIRFASGTWILMLDADERLPEGAVSSVRELCARTPEAVSAYRIPRVNYLADRPIRGSGWGLDVERHARLFRRTAVSWAPKVHSGPEFTGHVLDLPDEGVIRIEHANFRDFAHLLEKLNGYSTIEAQELVEAGGRPTLAMALRFALEEMTNRYDPEADGPLSLALSIAMFQYRFSCHAKAVEIAGWADEPVITREGLRAAVRSFWTELRNHELAAAAARITSCDKGDVEHAERVLSIWHRTPPLLAATAAVTVDGVSYEVPAAQFASDALAAFLGSGLEQVRVRVDLRQERQKRSDAEESARSALASAEEAERLLEATTEAMRDALQRLTVLEQLLADSQAREAALQSTVNHDIPPTRPSLPEPTDAVARLSKKLRRS